MQSDTQAGNCTDTINAETASNAVNMYLEAGVRQKLLDLQTTMLPGAKLSTKQVVTALIENYYNSKAKKN